jgi:FAD:protein FMN transferase
MALQSGCNGHGLSSKDEISKTGLLMGTFTQIKAASDNMRTEDVQRAVDGAFALGRELEMRMSVFDETSEVNKLNFSKSMKVSSDLMRILSVSKKINELTSGSFDPTVSPVLKRNGFYSDMPEAVLSAIPENDEGVGFSNVVIDEDSGVVVLEKGAWLDLSGIAKGYIVDRMSSFLADNGVKYFLVNAGGDIFCGGRSGSKKWRIGIRRPGTEEIKAVLALESYAVATSGDYENVLAGEGNFKMLSHIVDPASLDVREMVPLGLTVIAPDCTTSDAVATASLVMGPEKAIEMAEKIEGIDIIALIRPGGRDAVMLSSGAKKHIVTR